MASQTVERYSHTVTHQPLPQNLSHRSFLHRRERVTYAVSEKWSLFKEKVLNKDFLEKMAKNGPYLVLILTKSPYFSKSENEKIIMCHLSCFQIFNVYPDSHW